MPTKIYKRKYKAVLHRAKGNSTVVISERFFQSIHRAISRGAELAILEGMPGDVLEISSSNFGYLVATVKLSVNAKSLSNLKIEFHVSLLQEK